MKECVFCRIVAGEIAAEKVYEDRDYLVFLDKFPKSPGHCQVVPKKHYRWVWDVEAIGKYFEICKKIANAQRRAFGTDMIVSHVIGDEVPHAHVWLVPQHKGAEPKGSAGQISAMIRSELEEKG